MYDNTVAKALCKIKGHKFDLLNIFLYGRIFILTLVKYSTH